MSDETQRVLIVDDHPLIRDGLRAVLERHGAGFHLTEAGTAAEALALAMQIRPQLVLLDINLPGMNGLDLIQRLRKQQPQARLLVIAGEADPWTVREAMAGGASGFLAKANTAGHLLAAIRAVQCGGQYLCPDARAAWEAAPPASAPASEPPGPAALSRREIEVLKRIALGETTQSIALALGISPKTVESHRRNILRRLRLQSVQDLTRYAIRHGLIQV